MARIIKPKTHWDGLGKKLPKKEQIKNTISMMKIIRIFLNDKIVRDESNKR